MGCGNSRPECLQTGLWKQPGRSASGRVQVLLRGPTGQWQNPEQPLPLANLAQIFLASTGTPPMKGKAAGGVCIHARAPHRLIPARAFPLGLGLI